MTSHERIYEGLKLAAASSPATLNNTPRVTAAVDLSRFHKVFALLSMGDMAAEAIDFRLETATASGFGGTVTSRVSATQLAADAANNDNKQVWLELDASQVNGDGWVRARAVTSGATGGVASINIFGVPKYSNQSHVASLVEIKHA
jgi:hypothetical protein